MAVVEAVILGVLIAGSATMLLVLFNVCKDGKKKSIEIKEQNTSEMDKEA